MSEELKQQVKDLQDQLAAAVGQRDKAQSDLAEAQRQAGVATNTVATAPSQATAPNPGFPPPTTAPRAPAAGRAAQLAAAAKKALQTGNRRDVAEYLRLRRQK